MRVFLVGVLAIALALAGCTPTDRRGTADGGEACPGGRSPGSAGVGDPVFPGLGNGGYDVAHYDLDLDVDPARNRLSAEAVIDAVATQDLTAFNLDFRGPPIRAVTVDGRGSRFCRDRGELTIVPSGPILAEERFSTAVSYAGSPRPVMRPGSPVPEGWVRISEESVTAGGLWGAEAAYFPANATAQDDDWLSEGFATYTEALWIERSLGPDQRDALPSAWLGTLGDRTRPLARVIRPEQLGDFVTYLRGGAALHALRLEVGDAAFFRILRRYATDHRHSSASTEDFSAVAERLSGRDLSRFFDAWLYREPVPDLPDPGPS